MLAPTLCDIAVVKYRRSRARTPILPGWRTAERTRFYADALALFGEGPGRRGVCICVRATLAPGLVVEHAGEPAEFGKVGCLGVVVREEGWRRLLGEFADG